MANDSSFCAPARRHGISINHHHYQALQCDTSIIFVPSTHHCDDFWYFFRPPECFQGKRDITINTASIGTSCWLMLLVVPTTMPRWFNQPNCLGWYCCGSISISIRSFVVLSSKISWRQQGPSGISKSRDANLPSRNKQVLLGVKVVTMVTRNRKWDQKILIPTRLGIGTMVRDPLGSWRDDDEGHVSCHIQGMIDCIKSGILWSDTLRSRMMVPQQTTIFLTSR